MKEVEIGFLVIILVVYVIMIGMIGGGFYNENLVL